MGVLPLHHQSALVSPPRTSPLHNLHANEPRDSGAFPNNLLTCSPARRSANCPLPTSSTSWQMPFPPPADTEGHHTKGISTASSGPIAKRIDWSISFAALCWR